MTILLQEKTFKLIESEQDCQAIIAFAVKHGEVFERLQDGFANAPATIEDGLHILVQPIFFTVDAGTIAMAFEAPKRKRRWGDGHQFTFSIAARQPGDKGLLAVGPSFAVGLFRMQQAIQAADTIFSLGFDPRPSLNIALKKYAAQIESALYWLAR